MTALSSGDLVNALLLIRTQCNHRERVRFKLCPSRITLLVNPKADDYNCVVRQSGLFRLFRDAHERLLVGTRKSHLLASTPLPCVIQLYN